MIGIGIIGPIACGKDTGAIYLNQVSIPKRLVCSKHFSYSLKLDEMLKPLYIPSHNRSFKQFLAIALEKHSIHILTDAIWEDIKKSEVNLAIISSIRFEYQIERWGELIPGFKLIYVDVEDRLRWERNNKRREVHKLPPITWAQFEKEHLAATDQNISRLKKFADYVVQNNGTLAQYQKKLLSILIKETPYQFH